MKICLNMDDVLELVLEGVSRIEPNMDDPHWLPRAMHYQEGRLVARPVYDDMDHFVGIEIEIEGEPEEGSGEKK